MPSHNQGGVLRKPISSGTQAVSCRHIDHLATRTLLPRGEQPEPARIRTVAQRTPSTVAREAETPGRLIDGRRGPDHTVLDGWPCFGTAALETLESIATSVRCRRGQEIYRQAEAIDHWYLVFSGLAKEQALLADGRHQIMDFLLPGDFFGFGAQHQHRFTVAVVLDGTVLISYPRREVERLAELEPQLGRLLREEAFEVMSRSQTRMLTLARTKAPQKVGVFLLEMAERLPGGGAEVFALPMSRYDIADYLGLSVEAVSRSLTKLKTCGAIRLAGPRRVSILDRDALETG
jgi:CRP/FNR family transcriptional regulator, nitrogen fixation regulation protein